MWGGGGAVIHHHPGRPTARKTNRVPLQALTLLGTALVYKPGVRVSSEEQGYLDWFIYGTTTNAPRIFKSPFWDPLILQTTMLEPMVLHALLAISSAHKRNVLDPANRARAGLPPDAQEVFLLKQYGGALKGMQSHLADEKKPKRQKLLVAIVMWSLLVLLEHIRGNFETGYMHLTHGSQLAKQFAADLEERDCNLKLFQFFLRVNDQTQIYWTLKLFLRQTGAATLSPSIVRAHQRLRFNNVTEAGYQLDILLEMIMHSVEQARKIPPAAIASRKLQEQEHMNLWASFESWLLAYQITMESLDGNMTCEDAIAWKRLRERYDIVIKMDEIRPLPMKLVNMS